MARQSKTKNHNNKNKQLKGRRRVKDLDEINDSLQNPVSLVPDIDLPGMGMFLCLECARYFTDSKTLENHKLKKTHRRRVKELKVGVHSQKMAEQSVGLN